MGWNCTGLRALAVTGGFRCGYGLARRTRKSLVSGPAGNRQSRLRLAVRNVQFRQYAHVIRQYAHVIRQYARVIRQYARAIRRYARAIRRYARAIHRYARAISPVRTCNSPVRACDSPVRTCDSARRNDDFNRQRCRIFDTGEWVVYLSRTLLTFSRRRRH